jgi:hypothetical protein
MIQYSKIHRTLLIVPLVTGFLLGVAGCKPMSAEEKRTRIQLVHLQKALYNYRRDTGRFPTNSESLGVLVNASGLKDWKGPYLDREMLNDPWRNPYAYGQIREIIFIASAGPNGTPETGDLDLQQGLSRGDDIVILMPDREP